MGRYVVTEIIESFERFKKTKFLSGDCNGSWTCLWSGLESPQLSPPLGLQLPRVFSPPIRTPNFPTQMIRLIFDGSKVQYHAGIEAVVILGRGTNHVLIERSGTYANLC